jgi:DNA-binding TFAR19-related protein (PDSD5 family)
MDDEEYARIRQKKLSELQRSFESSQQEELSDTELEKQKKALLKRILTPEAYGRIERVKLAYSDLASKVEDYILLLLQSGRINHIISDEEVKMLLRKLNPEKEIRIRRK